MMKPFYRPSHFSRYRPSHFSRYHIPQLKAKTINLHLSTLFIAMNLTVLSTLVLSCSQSSTTHQDSNQISSTYRTELFDFLEPQTYGSIEQTNIAQVVVPGTNNCTGYIYSINPFASTNPGCNKQFSSTHENEYLGNGNMLALENPLSITEDPKRPWNILSSEQGIKMSLNTSFIDFPKYNSKPDALGNSKFIHDGYLFTGMNIGTPNFGSGSNLSVVDHLIVNISFTLSRFETDASALDHSDPPFGEQRVIFAMLAQSREPKTFFLEVNLRRNQTWDYCLNRQNGQVKGSLLPTNTICDAPWGIIDYRSYNPKNQYNSSTTELIYYNGLALFNPIIKNNVYTYQIPITDLMRVSPWIEIDNTIDWHKFLLKGFYFGIEHHRGAKTILTLHSLSLTKRDLNSSEESLINQVSQQFSVKPNPLTNIKNSFISHSDVSNRSLSGTVSMNSGAKDFNLIIGNKEKNWANNTFLGTFPIISNQGTGSFYLTVGNSPEKQFDCSLGQDLAVAYLSGRNYVALAEDSGASLPNEFCKPLRTLPIEFKTQDGLSRWTHFGLSQENVVEIYNTLEISDANHTTPLSVTYSDFVVLPDLGSQKDFGGKVQQLLLGSGQGQKSLEIQLLYTAVRRKSLLGDKRDFLDVYISHRSRSKASKKNSPWTDWISGGLHEPGIKDLPLFQNSSP